jgi:uncharacterized protein YidB (DUF937 family)
MGELRRERLTGGSSLLFHLRQQFCAAPVALSACARRKIAPGERFAAGATETLRRSIRSHRGRKIEGMNMAKGFPSMTALLGLLAVAGYQNREKIGEMLRGTDQGRGATAGGAGGLLSGGLRELADSFRNAGHADKVDSWVGSGENKPCDEAALRATVGADTISRLSQQTGLTEDELVSRLCRTLPEAVDKYTPDGRLPS